MLTYQARLINFAIIVINSTKDLTNAHKNAKIAYMKALCNNRNLDKLNSVFPMLTERNQCYMLGLAEGLKHAQRKEKGKISVKIPVDSQETKSVFYSRSDGRKTCP